MNKYAFNIIFGIDVGIHGGISVFDTVSEELLSLYPMPTVKVEKNGKNRDMLDITRLKFILEIPKLHRDSALVVFENIHAFPGQGSVSTGVLMEQKGIIRGLVAGLGYTELQVNPRTWQKEFDIVPPKDLKGTSAKQTKTLRKKWLKEKSLSVAKERFPEWIDKIGKSDGLSDSLLVGQYALILPTE